MRVRIGSNVAIVVALFGVSLLESVRSRTWVYALLFGGFLVFALIADSRGKDRDLSKALETIKRHEGFDIEPRDAKK
jgi:hypothetical protein